MNIKQAKEQIKNAVKVYFSKNKFGEYNIPVEKQRPVFLMGPPGIGKTAIMEQIAGELDVALVSYSMTHHTRQSALGLPFIVHKQYGDTEFDVSEYTMSEIISSVYDVIEATGIKEGILFLDEINCVSETLAPIMLQFLQYKIFGKHRVPEGWIVVTAGNPPEYNNSVREFDIVTWDRLKRIDVEPDFDTWKEYAYKKGVHPSIMSYLETKKSAFYSISSTADGKEFVTARGWDDLSTMIICYEKNNIEIDEKLISQYLQNKKIAKDFAIYYDLFNKYRSDYQVEKILDGTVDNEIIERAQAARFDERYALLGIIIDTVTAKVRDALTDEITVKALLKIFKKVRNELKSTDKTAYVLLDDAIEDKNEELKKSYAASNLSQEKRYEATVLITALESVQSKVGEKTDPKEAFNVLKDFYDKKVEILTKSTHLVSLQLSNIFKFCEKAFTGEQEMLILVTELTINHHTAQFIGKYGCDEYFKHNKELLFYERQQEIIEELTSLDLNDD